MMQLQRATSPLSWAQWTRQLFGMRPRTFLIQTVTLMLARRLLRRVCLAMNAQFVHVWRVKDGKAISFQQYADTYQVVNAMRS